MNEERRGQQPILRAGLAAVDRIAIPPGKKGRAVIVTDFHGVGIGVAWRTERGWEFDGNVQAAFENGVKVQATGSVEW